MRQLIKRSLTYYWRTNIAVVLGVATAVAVLAGALLVGDSVRASLRDLVVQRLGQTSLIITSNNFMREQLAQELQNDPLFAANGFAGACPLIALQGSVTHEGSKRLAAEIKVYGVDDRFWRFQKVDGKSAPQNRFLFISPTLAGELKTKIGDPLLLRIQKPSQIPLESLHSKKDDIGKTLRVTIGEVLSDDSLGEFSLQPQQSGVRAVFVNLKLLQQELEQPDKVNLLLVSESTSGDATASRDALNRLLRERVTLVDLGIKLRSVPVDDKQVISLENDSMSIDDSLAAVAVQTANGMGLQTQPVFSYLANSISSGDRSIPYSLVTAIDEREFELNKASAGDTPPIVLNEWSAQDLGVRPGDTITLEYYLWQEGDRLETKTATFRLASVVPIKGLAADRNLVPEYPGITSSPNLSDWDPPFPIDLDRIREKDEEYWHQYRTTPKAFLPITTGQSLWQTRFGKLTSIRFGPIGNDTLQSFQDRLRAAVNPTLMGVVVVPVRSEGLAASRGATDFGEYFLYFSFFLVVSALLLTTLFFKLGIEQRIREIGILRAVGFAPAKIRKLFVLEGAILAVVGSLIGLAGAIGYGQLMMYGLRTWWVDAVGTSSLKLNVAPVSLALGGVGGITAALVCVVLTLRSLRKQSTRSLLAGVIANTEFGASKARIINSFRIAVVLSMLGLLLLTATVFQLIGQAAGFFGGGTLLLVALLFYQSSWLRRKHQSIIAGNGWWPVARLGFRNTTYRPARSILCIALIASATFIIVAVDSFRHREATTSMTERKSGTGGYPLLAESIVPLVKNPNTPDGREELNLSGDSSELKDVTFTPFRLRPGDDASCLNLYQPRNPRIIGATGVFINTNRFVFSSSLEGNNDETSNPWLLLNRQFPDGAVPVIADANSLTYVLHLKLGDDLVIQQGDKPVHLRVVAALSNSMFQSEMMMSEANFIRLFPEQQGYRFFLIDLPDPSEAAAVSGTLEDRLADFGFDVQSTGERLASFHRVENTYLSTFQMLGGLGLILGTIGLSAVLLRNVLERRRELALLRAVGYHLQHFTLMILAENAMLLVAGVMTGVLCALLAITPVLFTRQAAFSNLSLGLLLLAVLISGLIASIVATWAALRTPLLAALRAE